MKKYFILLFLIIITDSSVSAAANYKYSGFSNDSNDSLENKFAPIITQAFNELKVPGIIAGIWIGENTSYIISLGYGDIEKKTPITADDRFRIASITKTFTGTVILQLRDEGKLDMSDAISKYLPGYPNGDNITIEELGNMTSGIFEYSDDKMFEEESLKNFDKPLTPEQLIEVAAKNPPYFPTGKGVYYSNTNFMILGVIIEKITGNDIASEIKRRILDPLEMTSTIFAMTPEIPDPHAYGYMYADASPDKPVDVTGFDPAWTWASGAMVSTMNDLYKYAKPLITGKLVSPSSQEIRMTWGRDLYLTFGTWKDRAIKYGFGLEDFGGAYGHCGEVPGFNSFMAYIPEKDMTIIVLANMMHNKEELSPADYIARAILGTL